jgi:hypothetical protein
MTSAMTSVAINIVIFDVITGFSKPEKPDIISIYRSFRFEGLLA